jgi:cobalt-zinc-cadmium efflux system outer membrane protein
MRKRTLGIGLAIAVVGSMFAASAAAEPACGGTIGRADVARCASAASLDVRVEEQEAAVREGRRRAAASLLRSNPVVAVTGAKRNSDLAKATNWSATLSQELEIAGQRGARLRAAEHEIEAQSFRIEVARRDAVAAAWVAYFDVLARGEEQRLMSRLSTTAAQIAVVARGMADKGALAPIDADVADAGVVAADQARVEADAALRRSELTLASLLGLPDAKASGELVPLQGLEQARPATVPEAKAFAAEAKAQESAASAYSRARVPNPTLSLFVQNDGFDERVLGAGVSIPIPLPHPVGRFYDGEIAEARAAAARAAAEGERARRRADLALGSALATYEAAKSKRDLYTDERITRAERDIEAIAKELQAGRVAVRDALLTQQALVTLLRAGVEARHTLCTASVELARAANVLDRGAR